MYPGDDLSPSERCHCRCIAEKSVPAKVLEEPEEYARDDGEGHWVTIGGKVGEDGKRHGGSPVFIKGGQIKKVLPVSRARVSAA